MGVAIEEIEALIERLYVGADGASLRQEERKKARELHGVIAEIGRAVDRISRARSVVHIVDAAAGKACASLLAVPLAIAPRGRTAIVHAIERVPERVAAITAAARSIDAEVRAIAGDVGDPSLWPAEPDVVIALHACGDASDRTIERATGARARWILVAPCCVAGTLESARRADRRADAIGLPRSGELRRGFVESLVMGERALELESRGWRTEIVPFAPPTVTPHRLLLRAERVGERVRMQESARQLERLREP